MADKHALPMLTDTKDAEKVQAAIVRRYGFTPTLEYCRDLIAFVEAMSREPRRASRRTAAR